MARETCSRQLEVIATQAVKIKYVRVWADGYAAKFSGYYSAAIWLSHALVLIKETQEQSVKHDEAEPEITIIDEG